MNERIGKSSKILSDVKELTVLYKFSRNRVKVEISEKGKEWKIPSK
jgi:hypothetical protein